MTHLHVIGKDAPLLCPHCREDLHAVLVSGDLVAPVLKDFLFEVWLDVDGTPVWADLKDPTVEEAHLFDSFGKENLLFLEAVVSYAMSGSTVDCPSCRQGVILGDAPKPEALEDVPVLEEVDAVPMEEA